MMRRQRAALMRRVDAFTTRHPLVGPIFWILGVQYFVTQLVVAAAWPRSYSWPDNLISDLGAVQTCGLLEGRYVCSPLHDIMNLSFMLFGVTILAGAFLIYTEFKRTSVSRAGFVLIALSGIGGLMVGLFPIDSAPLLHNIGAFLALLLGNIGLLLLGYSLQGIRGWFRVYTYATGVVCIGAFWLFVFGVTLGIGPGNMERVASYPYTIWMLLLGMYMTVTRLRYRF